MKTKTDTALTPTEAKDLKKLERLIDAGLAIFHRVGTALAEIQSRRLYRATHASFEAYIHDRFGFGRAHGYRLIAAAEVVENLSPVGRQLPATEREARPLTKLDPDDQRAAWGAATADGHDPDADELASLTQEFLDSPTAQAKLDAAEKFRERLRIKAEQQDRDAVRDEEGRRWRKALDHCRLARKELRGVVGSEEEIEHLEAVMLRACSETDTDPHSQGLRAA